MQLHNELLTTMVMYIGRLAAAGQLPLLRQIGLSPPQIERIGRLSLAEMNELSTFGSHFMDIKVDAESFERALAVLGRRLGENTVTERLLRAGACYPVMKELTGMETREFVAQWRMLGLANTATGGRRSRMPKGSTGFARHGWIRPGKPMRSCACSGFTKPRGFRSAPSGRW